MSVQSIDSLLHPLHNEVRHIHRTFELWKRLFMGGEEQGELLRRTAGEFFSLLDSILPDDVMMSIARLLDPARTGNRANYTIEYLMESLPPSVSPSTTTVIQSLVLRLRATCQVLKTHRDKRLAHADRGWIESAAAHYSSPTIQDVEEAVSLLRDLTVKLTEAFTGESHCFDGIWLGKGGAGGILAAADRAAKWTQLRTEAVQLGPDRVMQILRRGEW